jgi:DNA-binding transcriptional regulator YhcF (GntR family)
MRKTMPALDRATVVLQQLVSEGRLRGDRRLPTIRSLGRSAGVSYVTMWKAVDAERRRGVLTTNHRTGISIVSPMTTLDLSVPQPAVPATGYEPRYKWQKLCVRIQQNILKGVYQPGSQLYAPKELMRTYGVCYETLHKALERLVEEGALAAHHRGYNVPQLSGGRNLDTVVLYADGDSDGRPALVTNRSQDHFRALESECSRSGVALALATCDSLGRLLHTPAGLVGQTAADGRGQAFGLGALVWTVGLSTAPAVAALVGHALGGGRPVAVLDETGEHALPHVPGGCGRLFTLASSPRSGRHVGRFLLSLSHRRVAYISPVHSMAWSRNRLAGLAAVYAESGMADGVLPFTLDGGWYPVRTDDLTPIIDGLASGGAVASGEQRLLLARALRSSVNAIDMAMRREYMHDALLPLLQQAHSDPTITAWVAATDGFALDGLDFLRQQGAAVPADVSVVGFDDTHEALQHGLTSYNFNCGALMHAMLAHLFGQRQTALRRQPLEPVEVEGFINARRTTGKPPGRS